MDTTRGCWLFRPNGQIVELPVDPETDLYLEPGTLPDKAPACRTEILDPESAYSRMQLVDGPRIVAVYYSRRELSPDEKLRLSNVVHSSYGRD